MSENQEETGEIDALSDQKVLNPRDLSSGNTKRRFRTQVWDILLETYFVIDIDVENRLGVRKEALATLFNYICGLLSEYFPLFRELLYSDNGSRIAAATAYNRFVGSHHFIPGKQPLVFPQLTPVRTITGTTAQTALCAVKARNLQNSFRG